MTDKAAATFLIALACAGIGAAAAAPSATAPQMNTGHTNGSAKTPAVSPSADQIAASNALGAVIQDQNGAPLAKIADLAVDRHSAAVALAIITPLGGASFKNGKSTVAWSSLRFQPKPTPHYVTTLSRQALAAGASSLATAKISGDYYDVKKDLLGKEAVGTDGASTGHIKDLVLNFGTGRLVALVIDTGGIISIGAKDHAVAWDAAKPRVGTDGAPVRLALSKAEVEAAPVTATMAPAPVPAQSQSGGNATVIRHDSTGNISGSSIPVPATNRK